MSYKTSFPIIIEIVKTKSLMYITKAIQIPIATEIKVLKLDATKNDFAKYENNI